MPAYRTSLDRLLPASLRVRLSLLYGALVLLVLLGFTGFVYLEVRSALYNSLDQALESRAAQVAAVTTLVSGGVQFQTDGLPSGLGDAGTFIFDLHGRQLAPPDAGPGGLRPNRAAVGRAVRGQAGWSSGGDTVRLYTAILRDDVGHAFIIQIAGSREGADATLDHVLAALLLAVPLLVLVSGAGGVFLAGRALQPIDRITRTARRIGAGDLHERIGQPPRDDEVGRLASTFDAMLDRLEGAFLRQRQFTADASHELRTPLTILTGEVEIARRRRRSPEVYEATLDTIGEQVAQMTGIVEELLALARADSGQAEIEREVVELDDLVQRAVDRSRPLFAAKGLSMDLYLEPGSIVIGDPGMLLQMLFNLLGNAARYTDRGGVRVRLRSAESQAEVTVADTGIGIPSEHLGRIFERFYRVDKARSRAEGGSGLGLAIAQWAISAHGGSISAESVVGQGSVFRVLLPLAPADRQIRPDTRYGARENASPPTVSSNVDNHERAPVT